MLAEELQDNELLSKIYFDCNATTPVLLGALKTALDTMQRLYGNPSSTHSLGLQAKHILEFSRKTIGQVIDADPEQIIFTSGATEAIHIAIFSALNQNSNPKNTKKTKLLYGATEHKVIPEALHHWNTILNAGYEIVALPVDESGHILIESLRKELPHAALLCTMAVNNETGVIHNLAEIESALLAANSTTCWLVDSVQALGKLDLKLRSSRIDYAAFSGHKLYAPKGIGFLYSRKDAPLTPLLVGGGQENGYRSGTENLPGIAALGFVLQQVLDKTDIFQSQEQLFCFRDQLVSELKAVFPQIIFNTPFDYSIPTTLNFSIPGLTSRELIDVFDQAGLCLSGGSACNSTAVQTSHVLDAMGKSNAISTSAIRLSFGPCTTQDEIAACCHILRECGIALRQAGLLDHITPNQQRKGLQDGVLQFHHQAANTWVITDSDTRSCIIIDPCQEVEARIEHYVKHHHLMVLAILDTHSHADHQSVRGSLQQHLLSHYETLQCNELGWPQYNPDSQCLVTLDDDTTIPALKIKTTNQGELVLAQLQTPGHTDDSQVFILGIQKSGRLHKMDIRYVFSGDTVLNGGLGRTNFPSSSPTALYYSLKKMLAVINPFALLCPAHDYDYSFATNFNTEISQNPLMQLALEGDTSADLHDFINHKQEIDRKLTELEKKFYTLICGITPQANNRSDLKILLQPLQLQKLLKLSCEAGENLENNTSLPIGFDKHFNTPLVISVLETQEFFVFKNWRRLGLKKTPYNVPLSYLTNFISELLSLKQFHREIVFICRSGERSLLAARVLHRLGFDKVWSLEGGLALIQQDLEEAI